MRVLKLMVSDRSCIKFHVVNAYSLKVVPTPKNLNPIKEKLCNQDIIKIENNGTISLLHSSVRSMQVIPGVLVLNDSKTYGKIKDRHLYRCIPDDRRLPVFLMAYKPRVAFSKNMTNKYVVFKFNSWQGKHPIATNVQTIGDVSELVNFYEYQLYCKSLYASIQDLTKKTMQKLKEKTSDEYIELIKKKHTLQDYREGRYIFSIDPETSRDFDDAFDIETVGPNTVRISVYISNVSFWMDAMDLWDSFKNRISSIYLPDRKRPMLPTVLSDALCSLTQNDERFALELALNVNIDTGEIESHYYNNAVIKVSKNLRYETEEQETDLKYIQLFNIVNKMNRKIRHMDSLDTSHDIVAYLMITMNCISAKTLIEHEKGTFRSATFSGQFKCPEKVPQNIKKFLKMWNSSGGNYCNFENIQSHEVLDVDAYVHITSPIRRLADLLNIMVLQDCEGLYTMSEKAREFYDYWTSDSSLEYINTTMRSIRKVQNDCSLLQICMENEEVLNQIHDGYIFDKIIRNDALFQYMVYLPELKMVNRFTSRHDKLNLSAHKFKLYVFIDESSLKQKLRVEVQTDE